MRSWSPSQQDIDHVVNLVVEPSNLRVPQEAIQGYSEFQKRVLADPTPIPLSDELFWNLAKCVKPRQIVQRLSTEALIWSRLQGSILDDEWTNEIDAQTPINASVLMQARTCMFQMYRCAEYEHVKRLYVLLNQEVKPRMVDIEPFAKRSIESSDYTVVPISLPSSKSDSTPFGYFAKNDPVWQMYLDAPVGAALCYKEKPEAMIAWMPNEHGNLMIHQLQGVQQGHTKNSWGLEPLDWRALLIEVSKDLARQISSPAVGIVSAANNPWTQTVTVHGKIKLPLERAIQAYDVHATRLGFEESSDDGNFYQTIL